MDRALERRRLRVSQDHEILLWPRIPRTGYDARAHGQPRKIRSTSTTSERHHRGRLPDGKRRDDRGIRRAQRPGAGGA